MWSISVLFTFFPIFLSRTFDCTTVHFAVTQPQLGEIFLNLGCISLYKIVLNQLILLYLFIHTKHTAFFSYHQQKPGVTRKVPKIFPPFLVNKREWHLVNPQWKWWLTKKIRSIIVWSIRSELLSVKVDQKPCGQSPIHIIRYPPDFWSYTIMTNIYFLPK